MALSATLIQKAWSEAVLIPAVSWDDNLLWVGNIRKLRVGATVLVARTLKPIGAFGITGSKWRI